MKKINILHVIEKAIPNDMRGRMQVETLKENYGITMIVLRKRGDRMYENLDGIQIIRLPAFPDLKLGEIQYILQYFYFTTVSTLIFLGTIIFNRYKVIHVHNPPDTLFVLGLLGKLFSIKFIFDHHDLSPELYLSRFSNKRTLIYKMLLFCERISCKLSDAIIATNESYRQIEADRHGINIQKIYVVRCNPIISECRMDNSVVHNNMNGKRVMLFLGSINPQDGLDILFKILHYLVNELNEKNFVCNIVGGGDSLDYAKQTARELNLMDYVDFKGYVYDRDAIKEYLSSSDICLEPAPDNELNRHSTFIKVMEYMAAGKPLVAFDLKETRYSTNGGAILVPPGDIEGFARGIKRLLDDRRLRSELGANGYERIKNELNWESASRNLVKAYESIME